MPETLSKDRSDNLRECSFVHVVLAVTRNKEDEDSMAFDATQCRIPETNDASDAFGATQAEVTVS